MTMHVVVDGRIVRRVIKHQRGLSGLGLQVPHGHCCVVERGPLMRVVSESELGRRAKDLPEAFVLVARPDRESPNDEWRRAFHGLIHHQLDGRVAAGTLTNALVRQRISRIGQTEFDEIRAVLHSEDLLFSEKDDREAYIEFAAFYLELRHFEPEAIDKYFPDLREPALLEEALAEDVDVPALLSRARPQGARELDIARGEPIPIPSLPITSHPPGPRRSRMSAATERFHQNVISPLIAALAAGHDAGADIDELADRLVLALGPVAFAPDAAAWTGVVTSLAEAAAKSSAIISVERRVLHDLQKACIDGERRRYAVDVVTWAVSFGKRPIVRPLPAVSVVRVARHVQHAFDASHRSERLEKKQRRHLERTFHAALSAAREQVRRVIQPELDAALAEVGLVPKSVPERVAAEKLAEEVIDLVLERGSFGLSQLRDALSRNSLKLANVAPRELFTGDAVLRLDARLAVSLDGVYRGGEIYLRFLQKVSSVAFGTTLGRLFTLHVALPLLAAFVLLEGVQHLAHPIGRALGNHHVSIAGPRSFLALAAFFYGLIHSTVLREVVLRMLSRLGSALWAVFVGLPLMILRSRAVQMLLRGRTTSVIAKPLVGGLVLYAVLRHFAFDRSTALSGTAGLALLFGIFLGTPVGLRVDEWLTELVMSRLRDLSRHVLPGFVAFVLDVFRVFVERVERFIYTVDEWLTFKDGQSLASRVVKGALGTVWFFITYLLRIYVNVLIEPQVNPIKHFPVVTVSHKIILPLSPTILRAVRKPLAPLGMVASNTIAGSTVFLLPGVFGFLTWELKENWKLYAQNRQAALMPVRIGHHGETMRGLLVRGFHSGTIPKVYAKLRRSVSRGQATVNEHRAKLHEVEHAIDTFVERELVGLLRASPRWGAGELSVRSIELASNRIRVGITCPEVAPEVTYIHFEEQSGWLVASLNALGFITSLAEGPRDTFETALAGLYKLAGVDLVREQIQALLGPGIAYDIADEGLVVWPGEGYQTEVVYDLSSRGSLDPVIRGEPLPQSPKALNSDKLVFAHQQITWDCWTRAFDTDTTTKVLAGPPLLSLTEASPG